MSEIPSNESTSGTAAARPDTDLAWERDLLTRLASAALVESRRARRWGLVFKFSLLLYLVVLLVLYLPRGTMQWGTGGERHTALVDVRGVIGDRSDASADRIVTGLRAAFEDEDTAGVILRINSPGGSPVQAAYINDEITRLRGENPDVPLYAVISDMAASGGYYVAAAADKIYANRSSLVGSIGVLMNGFGFVEAMDKVGVERRLLTAGEHKAFLDPFSPVQPDEVAHVEGLLGDVHRQFIEVVKRGRGDRLADDEELFSGLLWSGERSLELGLVDAFGSSSYVAREVIGVEDIKDFTPRRKLLGTLMERFGAALARALLEESGLGPHTLR